MSFSKHRSIFAIYHERQQNSSHKRTFSNTIYLLFFCLVGVHYSIIWKMEGLKLNVRWRRLLEKLYAVFVCMQQRALLHKSPKEYKQYTAKVLNLLKCNFSVF